MINVKNSQKAPVITVLNVYVIPKFILKGGY